VNKAVENLEKGAHALVRKKCYSESIGMLKKAEEVSRGRIDSEAGGEATVQARIIHWRRLMIDCNFELGNNHAVMKEAQETLAFAGV
jgi:hypothetical protein